MVNPNQAQEFDFDSAYNPVLKSNSDEFMLADDADLDEQEREFDFMTHSELVPFGWDYV